MWLVEIIIVNINGDFEMQAISKPDHDNFTLITHKSTSTQWVSSLYNFIEDYREKLVSSNILENLFEINNEDRDAYGIKLPLHQLKYSLYPNFDLVDAHLSIDKFYASDRSKKSHFGFSFAHYTEKLKKPDSDEEVIIHVYFNSIGEYCSIQIKVNGIASIIKNKTMHAQILENSKAGSKKLQELIMCRNERYMEIYELSKSLELQLEQAFQNKVRFEIYKGIAERFISQISLINRYSDFETDLRDKIILSTINDYQQIMQAYYTDDLESSSSIEQCDDHTEILTIPFKSSTMKTHKLTKEQKLHVALQSLEKKLVEEYNKLKSMTSVDNVVTAKMRLKQQECIQKVKMLSLQIFFLQDKGKGLTVTAKTQNIFAELNNIIPKMPTLKSFLEGKILSGKFFQEQLQKLFSSLQTPFSYKEYFKMLFEIIINKKIDDSYATKIFEFFLEKSHLFRVVFKSKHIGTLIHIGEEINASLPALAFAFKRLNLFCNFIRHYSNPADAIATLSKEKRTNLLKFVLNNGEDIASKEKYSEILRILIKDSNDLEKVKIDYLKKVTSYITFEIDEKKVMTKKIAGNKSHKQPPIDDFLDKTIADNKNKEIILKHLETVMTNRLQVSSSSDFCSNCCLGIICESVTFDHIEIATFKWLAEQSSLEDTMIALGVLTNRIDVYTGYRFTDTWQILVSATKISEAYIGTITSLPKLSMAIHLNCDKDEMVCPQKEHFSLIIFTLIQVIQNKVEQTLVLDDFLNTDSLYMKFASRINNIYDQDFEDKNKLIEASNTIKVCNFMLFLYLIKCNSVDFSKEFIVNIGMEFAKNQLKLSKSHYSKGNYEFASDCASNCLIIINKVFPLPDSNEILQKLKDLILECKNKLAEILSQYTSSSRPLIIGNTNISSNSSSNKKGKRILLKR